VNASVWRIQAPGRAAAALVTGGVAAAVLLTGCGAGQISQTAMQEPAINGISGRAGDIALRNVHLRVDQFTDYVQPGRQAELIFTAANGSPDVNDRLVSITTDIGTVALTGNRDLPANGSLVVGVPDGQTAPLQSVEAADAADAKVTLSKPITNGLTYDMTFTFEKSGQATLPVPISAGEEPRRAAVAEAGGSAGHESGH
jgi:hypothetical protein